MSGNVWPDDVFWTTEQLVAKPGRSCSIISQNVLQKNWFTVFSVEVTEGAYVIKI